MADYYRPKNLSLNLGGTEKSIQSLIAQVQNAYDFLERDAKENFPENYEGDLENAAREQISEANKKIEELRDFIESEGYKFDREGTRDQFIYELDNKYLEPLRATIQGNVVGGIDPSMKERWGTAFEGERWNEGYNPIRSIQMKYQDFGLGPGMGYKPKEHSTLGWDLATAALGFIPGVGIPLAAAVGAINRGTDKGAGIEDWLMGGLKGGISAYGASKLGSAISNILPKTTMGTGIPLVTDETAFPLLSKSYYPEITQAFSQGGNMASLNDILNWVSPVSNLTIDGNLYNPLEAANLWVNPSSIKNIAPEIFAAGLPSSTWETLGTAGLDLSGLGNLTVDGAIPNWLSTLGKTATETAVKTGIQQILGGGGGGGGGGQSSSTNWLTTLLNTLLGGGGGTTEDTNWLNKLLQLGAMGTAGYLSGEQMEDYQNWIERLYEPQLEYQKSQLGLFKDVFEPTSRELGGYLSDELTKPFSLTPELEENIWGKARERVGESFKEAEQVASERFAGSGMLGQGPAQQYFNDLGLQKIKSLEDVAVEQSIWEYGQKYKEKQDKYANLLSFIGKTPSVGSYGTPTYAGEMTDFSKLVDIFSPAPKLPKIGIGY